MGSRLSSIDLKCLLGAPRHSGLFDHYSLRIATFRLEATSPRQRFKLNRFPNRLILSLTWPTVVFLALRRSCADSRSSVLAYFSRFLASASINARLSFAVKGPTRDMGGRTSVRCTTEGSPLLCKTDTSASPT